MMIKNLKNEYPDVPENFHNRVISTLDGLQSCEKQTKIRRDSPVRIAALAAALVLMLTVTVFAGNEVYKRFINKENYKVSFELEEETYSKSAEYVKLNFGYMPEYLVPYDAPYKFSIGEHGASGLTFQLFKSELAKELEINFVGSVEECMFGKYRGAVVRIDTGIDNVGESYSRNFVIYFDDFGYVLRCYVADAISDEDMMKIANGLSLEESDKEHAYIIDTYIPGSDTTIFEYDNRQNVYRKTGEEFAVSVFSGEEGSSDYSVTVNSFEILDNVADLDYNSFCFDGQNIDEYIDKNGNLKDYVRKIYESGDGVNTLNSLKDSKTVGRKLVIVNMKIKNMENCAHTFYPEFILFNKNGECISSSINYISGQNADSAKYRYIHFGAGEIKTVTFGFIADADVDFKDLMLEVGCESSVNYYIYLNN